MYRDNPLSKISWEDFQNLTPAEKGPYFLRDGRPYHTLISQQFDRPMLETLCALATKIRKIGKTKGGIHFLQSLLSEKRAMLYFSQPSSRTFLSFYAACQILGMKTAEVRDASTSSEVKGESPEDSVRTFSSYFDLIIMRNPVGGFASGLLGFCRIRIDRFRFSMQVPVRISIPPRLCWISIRFSAVSRSVVESTERKLCSLVTWLVAAPFARWQQR